jgi:hypothetical protein
MTLVGLPARIGYAVAALPAAGAAAFYLTIWLLPILSEPLIGESGGQEIFLTALGVAAVVGFTAFLMALTLPWVRRRRRSGRGVRISISCVVVLVASLAFAGQGHAVYYDLAFAAWLAYVMAFTFVRYGVLDRAKRPAILGGSTSRDYVG